MKLAFILSIFVPEIKSLGQENLNMAKKPLSVTLTLVQCLEVRNISGTAFLSVFARRHYNDLFYHDSNLQCFVQ